ncbi:MAG TPA: RNA polymerase sigma factor [Candidatus Dormibacteraeota bacterium]|nr:RNA polymerase sigma factor [Candidatus Dormibacteraeota bacterium]
MPSAEQQPGFDSLLLENFNQVLSYLGRLTGDLAVAHRLSEETFDHVSRYYRKGRPPQQARALLFLVATGRARDHLKKGDRRSIWQRFFSRPRGPLVEFTEEDAKGLGTDTSQRALSTLDFGDRVVLLLHDYCGLDYEEVARAAGIGRTSVPRDLDRARHDFKQAYDYIRF